MSKLWSGRVTRNDRLRREKECFNKTMEGIRHCQNEGLKVGIYAQKTLELVKLNVRR